MQVSIPEVHNPKSTVKIFQNPNRFVLPTLLQVHLFESTYAASGL